MKKILALMLLITNNAFAQYVGTLPPNYGGGLIYSQDTDKFWGMQQGATDYITKPYEKQQILEILRQYLSREQAE